MHSTQDFCHNCSGDGDLYIKWAEALSRNKAVSWSQMVLKFNEWLLHSRVLAQICFERYYTVRFCLPLILITYALIGSVGAESQ